MFLDSEYLFIIQSFNIILIRVTLRGFLKLFPYPFEVMDVSLGRSKNQFIHSLLLSIINEQDELLYLPASAPLPSLIKFKCGRSIIHSFKSFKYLISLLIRNHGMHHLLIQSNSNMEDLFIISITLIIPLISNEDQQKLYDSLPISPISIVVKLGRFFNSNNPP